MLTGQYKSTLDEKGRILIPSRLRADIPGATLVVTAGIDCCLWAFLPEDWGVLADKLMQASPFAQKTRLLQRRIIAPAQELELDKMGRILLPPNLKDVARIRKDCTLHGLKRYLEIWDVHEYEEYLAKHEEDFQKAAEELGGSIEL